jgi:signal transduction histidine kinase
MRTRRAGTAFHILRSTTVLIVGAVTIVCACLGIILWVLGVATSSVDDAQQDGDHRLMHTVFETYQQKLAEGVSDYSNWTEIYDNFMLKRDASWERENLGPYIVKTFDIDYVLVTSNDGAVVYAYSRKQGEKTTLSQADLATLAALTRAAPKVETSEQKAVASGVVELDGSAGFAAVATIRPTTVAGIQAGIVTKYNLVEIRTLSPRLLATTGRNFGVTGLAVTRAPDTGIVLRGIANAPSGFALTWTPKGLGQRLYDRVLPAVVVIGALLLLGFLALIAFWWRIVDHIRAHEARALNAEIETTRARAAAAEEMTRNKSAFIANMSHELRTPLNAIIGFSEFMESEPLGPMGVPKYLEYVKLIANSGHHLLRIINDILLISKVEAGKFAPQMESMQISDVLRDCLQMMEVVAARRNITLNTSACACHAIVLADRQALRQIFINVLSNAIKFSPDHSSVEIECTGADAIGNVLLRITDHGCGMPPETLRELGKPFVQAEAAYTRKFEGTGIGLAICYRLAAAMGVSIDVKSAVGAGTTVTILIGGLRTESAPRAKVEAA